MAAAHPSFVSVVITVFQAETHIARALRSATMLDADGPVEIILFDDGSTDGTLTAARAEAEVDPRIIVIEGGRQGRARALNQAITAAGGRYIAILDADDIALPHRLRATLPMLEANPELVMACSEAIVFEGDAPERPAGMQTGARISRITPATLYASNRITHSTVLFRRTAWEQAGGYDERLDICIDYAFYFRLLRVGGIAHTDTVTCLRERRANSYFAAQRQQDYTDALSLIRAEARSTMTIPLWAKLAAAARSIRFGMKNLGDQLHAPSGTA
ncbi:glycosyltransferase [Nisaea sp.]|uniref:glycosyltransferase family 2 protein n=1 Tax=Nisaea sp. TaxID=2024842 RepID=UPI003296A1AF